jgi:hypothetical protein
VTTLEPRIDPERVGHEWRLVTPWWHWPKADGATTEDRLSVRTGAPVFQKYDDPDLVNAFLADPQQRLAFLESSDRVAQVIPGSTPLRMPTRKPTPTRKLFLASHHRHYLLVCGLHCDRPGFPKVDRAEVCETGFVVRRRKLAVPTTERTAAQQAVRRYSLARRRRAGAEAQLSASRRSRTTNHLRDAALLNRLEACATIEQDARAGVQAWAARVAQARDLQGWVPHGLDSTRKPPAPVPLPACHGRGDPPPLAGVGAWQSVTELPEELSEATFPLHPLVAEPGLVNHDAAGETLFFGVVPTGSSDVDLDGGARFDDQTVYEIRCFARRHRPVCPRDGRHCTCPITWSEPTEPYRLASHFDLEGSANKPVTVQMPDLAQLQADAFRLSPGGTGGVRFQQPAGSTLPFTAEGVDATQAPTGGFQICSFSIPLITIVAFFVFRLFLPIVIFVFQLWWMLLLKFCIPPEVDVSVDLDLALDALPPSFDSAFGVSVQTFLDDFGDDLDDAVEKATNRYKHRDGSTMTSRIAAVRSQFDDPSWVAFGRGLLANNARPVPDRVFADRVERADVVTP